MLDRDRWLKHARLYAKIPAPVRPVQHFLNQSPGDTSIPLSDGFLISLPARDLESDAISLSFTIFHLEYRRWSPALAFRVLNQFPEIQVWHGSPR